MNLLNRVTARVASASLLALASTLTIASTAKTLKPAFANGLQIYGSSTPEYLARRPRNRLRFNVGVRSSRYRTHGFSRSAECLTDQSKLTVIAPGLTAEEEKIIEQDKDKEGDSGIDTTISSHPMVFAYIPQAESEGANIQAQFTLEDEIGNTQIHNVIFDLPNQAGIVGIQIPSSAQALEQDKNYIWQLAIRCEPGERSEDVTIDRWITRISAPAGLPTDAQEMAIEFANQGFWQDAVSTLALLRYPNRSGASVETDWSDLLTSAGLPEFASAPIVQIIR